MDENRQATTKNPVPNRPNKDVSTNQSESPRGRMPPRTLECQWENDRFQPNRPTIDRHLCNIRTIEKEIPLQ